MFYKYNETTEEWLIGNEVHFPNDIKINSTNKTSHDGWEWHDEAPQEYLEWLTQQEQL